MNCHTFSTGLSSGHLGGSAMMVMLAGTTRRVDMCQPAWSTKRTAWAAGATAAAISARCRFIASGIPHRRYRWRRSAGHAVRLGGCRASPSDEWSCSSGRCVPRRRTRFLSCRSRAPWRTRFPPGARESFFKILNRALRLRMVARSGREFAVAHGAQLPAERLLGDRDAEFLEDPLRQIDQPPAHHAMDRRDRAALDHAGDGPPLKVIELARLTRRLAVQERRDRG